MNLDARKVELIEWVASLKDQDLLEKIEDLKKQAVREAYESELQPMSQQLYETLIAESEADIVAGRIYSHEDVVSYFKRKNEGV